MKNAKKRRRRSNDKMVVYGFLLFLFLAPALLFAFYKYDSARLKSIHKIAGPAYQQACRLYGNCGQPLEWRVCRIESAPDSGFPENTIMIGVTRANSFETFALTPTNEYHEKNDIALNEIVYIRKGQYTFGQIFSPYACDYIRITKALPPASQ